MPFAQKLKLLKKITLLTGLFIIGLTPLLYPNHAGAASYTWDGGGTDGTCGGNVGDGNKWSCAANWSSDIVPVAGDNVTFNATSTKDAVIDASFQGNVVTFTISAGYTGTITQQRSLTVTGAFAQSDGFFNASNQTTTFSSSFTLNSGANFTASSSTTSSTSTFTINAGATFNHNNGTVSFGGTSSVIITCNGAVFNSVIFAHTAGTKTVASTCTLPIGNNPSLGGVSAAVVNNGTLSGTGTLTTFQTFTIASSSALSGFSAISSSLIAYNGGNFGSISSLTTTSTLTLSSNLDPTIFTTFSPASITINTGVTFNSLSPFILSVLTVNSGGVFNAPSDTLTVNSTFTVNAGGTFNHNNGVVSFAGTASVTYTCNGTVFNSVIFAHTAGTKTVGSTCTLPLGNNPSLGTTAAAVTNNGILSGSGTLTTFQTFNIASGSTLSGFSAISSSLLAYNGGSFGSITSLTTSSTMTLSSNLDPTTFITFAPASITINSGVTFNSLDPFTLSVLIVNSGGVFNAPSGTLTVNSTFTINVGGTFNHNNGTVNFGASTATLTCNGTTFNTVNFTHTAGIKTITVTCTFPLGNNPSLGTTAAAVINNGTLTGTGILNTFQTFTLGGTGNLSGFTALNSNAFTNNGGNMGSISSLTTAGAITITGVWNASAYTTFTSGTTFTINSGGNFTAPSLDITHPSTFTMNTGSTYTASSGLTSFSAALTINGGTFNHNSGSVRFGGTSAVTLSCNNVTFNSVTFAHTTGVKTVSANCTFPLGTNPLSTGPITLNGGLTGSGDLTVSGALTMNSGSSLNCFSSINATPFTYNGGTFCGGAPFTWDGGGTDGTCGGAAGDGNKWSCAANWSTDAVPTSFSDVVFDGTSTKNSVIDNDFGGNILNMTINSGYTGTITQQRSLSMLGVFTQAAGTFDASNQSFSVTLAYTLNSGGTFTASSGTSTFLNSFTINSGSTFNHNNGTLVFAGTSSVTLSCNNATFNLVNFTHTTGTKTISTNCTLPLDPATNIPSNGALTVNGIISGSNLTMNNGTLTLNAGSQMLGFKKMTLINGAMTISTILDASAVDDFYYVGGAFTLNSGAVFTAPPGYMWIVGNIIINAGSTFNHNNGTIKLTTSSATSISCNNIVFNRVEIVSNFSGSGAKTVGSNCTLPLGVDPVIDGPLVLNGTISGSGTITTGYVHTLNSGSQVIGFTGINTKTGPTAGAVGSGLSIGASHTFDASTYTTFVMGNSFTTAASSVFTAPTTMNVARGFTINSASTFNHNNGTIIFNGTVSATIACGNKTLNSVVFAHTAGNKNVTSDCDLPIGADPTVPDGGGIVLTGTLTGSGTLTASFLQMDSPASLNCFALDVELFIYLGGTICGGGSITWDGEGSDGTCGGAVGDGNKWSCALNWSGDTVPGTLDPVIFDTTSTKDSVIDPDFSGNVLAITVATGYTGIITQQRSLTMNGYHNQSDGTFNGGNHPITIYGTFTLDSPAVYNAPSQPFFLQNAFTLNTGTTFNGSSADMDLLGSFTINSGSTFTSTSGILSVRTAFTINSGATFNHNNGTVNFNADSQSSTLTCNGAVFNLVTFDYLGTNIDTNFTKIVGSTCILPLGNDPIIENNITLQGTLTGTGTFYTGYTLTLQNSSDFTGFTAIDSVVGPTANSFGAQLSLTANKNFDASSMTHITLGSAFIMQGNTVFTAPPIMTVGRNFNMNSTAAFIHNNGTVIFTDPQVIPTFDVAIWCSASPGSFNHVIFAHTQSTKTLETASSGPTCVYPLGNNPTIEGGLILGLTAVNPFNANLTGTGTLTMNAHLIQTSAGTISNFDHVIFNDAYLYTTPTFTDVGKLTFNESKTFATTFDGSQVEEIQANDDVIFSGGTFTAPASMKIAGDWTNSGGTFTHNGGTVEFIDTNDKTITGNTTFNNLKYAPATDPTLSFAAGSTQTILGTLMLKGQARELIYLQSTVPGSVWNIDLQGDYIIEYVGVSDGVVLNNTITVGCDSVDEGNNTSWQFPDNCSFDEIETPATPILKTTDPTTPEDYMDDLIPPLPETGEPEITPNDVLNTKTPIKLWHLIVCFSPVLVIIAIMFIPLFKKREKVHTINQKDLP